MWNFRNKQTNQKQIKKKRQTKNRLKNKKQNGGCHKGVEEGMGEIDKKYWDTIVLTSREQYIELLNHYIANLKLM